jgi:hypothetical protein
VVSGRFLFSRARRKRQRSPAKFGDVDLVRRMTDEEWRTENDPRGPVTP